MSATKFTKGDRIAWSHVVAPEHEEGNIIRASSVLAKDPAAKLGTVVGNNADVKTHYDVLIDGDKAPRTFTAQELVKVKEEKAPAA